MYHNEEVKLNQLYTFVGILDQLYCAGDEKENDKPDENK